MALFGMVVRFKTRGSPARGITALSGRRHPKPADFFVRGDACEHALLAVDPVRRRGDDVEEVEALYRKTLEVMDNENERESVTGKALEKRLPRLLIVRASATTH